MKITEIWRYPVKTMAGEKLQRVAMGSLGIEGDRVVHIEDARSRVITSRSHPRFLGHHGSLGTDGVIMVDGRRWDSPEVAAEVVDIAGPGAKLVHYDGAELFDGKLALNCFVIEGSEIAVGDEVQLVRGRACAESAAFID